MNAYQLAWSRPGHSPSRDSSKVSATRTLQRPEVRARLTYLRQEATKGENNHAADLSPTGLRNLLDEVTGVLLTLQDAAARAGIRLALVRWADTRDGGQDAQEVLSDLLGDEVSTTRRKVTFEKLDYGGEWEADSRTAAHCYVLPSRATMLAKIAERFDSDDG